MAALVALIQEFDQGKAIEAHLARDEPNTEQFELRQVWLAKRNDLCAASYEAIFKKLQERVKLTKSSSVSVQTIDTYLNKIIKSPIHTDCNV